MIDPIEMTRYDLSAPELEETILFCACVAGKNAVTTARCLDSFLHAAHISVYGKDYRKTWGGYLPFELLRAMESTVGEHLPAILRSHGLGCYNHRSRTFYALAASGLDLRTCTVDDLEQVPGIGLKTSRFFLLHTRREVVHAVIDTHVLKHLRACGYPVPEKPSLTPRRYREYEGWFLEAWQERGGGVTLAEYDLAVWNHYAGYPFAKPEG